MARAIGVGSLNVWLKLLPVAASALALVFALGYGFSRPKPFIVNNAVLAEPQALPSFELQSTHGLPFTNAGLQGQWSLLFSGYTQCPDVCPTTLSLLIQLQQDWPAASQPFTIVFVTVDPQQDGLADMRAYLEYFGDQVVGLTGRETQLNGLLQSIGFYPVTNKRLEAAKASESRLLRHSGAVALINPQGELHALLRAPLSLVMLQAQLQQILAAS